MTYLITFTCYGSHLHGDESGSVDQEHNLVGSRTLEPDHKRTCHARRLMVQQLYRLDSDRRAIVLKALQEICSIRGWSLLAAHVRTSHVHVVVATESRPEELMNRLKCHASRCLNQLNMDQADRKRWTRHGSTRWLWKSEHIAAAIRYVVDGQGEPMAVFQATKS